MNKRLTPRKVWDISVASDKKHKKYIPYAKFNAILKLITLEMDDMLLEGKSIYLPARMGALRLKKFKPKKLLPDWKATKKLWEVDETMREERFLIMQDNAHTSGWRVKLTWSKFNCDWTNKGLVVCKRTRGFERKLAWLLKTDSLLITKIKE
jgi:hypothetical protein